MKPINMICNDESFQLDTKRAKLPNLPAQKGSATKVITCNGEKNDVYEYLL